MLRKFRFIYINIIRLTFGKILSLFVKRDSKYCILSLKVLNNIESFMHNSKYFYLYLNNCQSSLIGIWLCDNKKMIKEFKIKGCKNVYTRNSIKGIYYSLKAKYWMYDINPNSISAFSNGATFINFWHGIPLKKIGFDAIQTSNIKKGSFQEKIYSLIKVSDDYIISNNDYEKKCYNTAFFMKDDQIIMLGSPRLDVLHHDFENMYLFMEEDYINIKRLKDHSKKLIYYMPTFRDTGVNISKWLKSNDLETFLEENNAVLVCKLHYADVNSLNFNLSPNFYKINNQSDIYSLLKFSDCLLTDYSSIYFDYLLLDKPIIYYPIDLKEYQEKCRGFYRPYDELTAGVKAYNEQELIKAIQDVINGIDNYKEERKVLRDKMFKYQDGRNCERVLEWIKSLDK